RCEVELFSGPPARASAEKGAPMRTCFCFLCLVSLMILGCGPSSQGSNPAKSGDSQPAKHGKIELSGHLIKVERGQSTKLQIKVKRLEGFAGEVKVQVDPQQTKGIDITSGTIPADQDTVDLTINASADAVSGLIAVKATGAFEDYPGIKLMVNVR